MEHFIVKKNHEQHMLTAIFDTGEWVFQSCTNHLTKTTRHMSIPGVDYGNVTRGCASTDLYHGPVPRCVQHPKRLWRKRCLIMGPCQQSSNFACKQLFCIMVQRSTLFDVIGLSVIDFVCFPLAHCTLETVITG